MPGRYQLADIQADPPPRKGAGAYSLADIDSPATPKPPAKDEPTFGSRLYETTAKPFIDLYSAVSDRAAKKSGSPLAALGEVGLETITGVAKGFAERYKAQPGANMPARALGALTSPIVDPILDDAAEGNYGAAVGGVAGLLLPLAPKGVKAAGRVVDGAAVVAGTKGAIKGGSRAALTELGNTVRQAPTVGDLTASGLGYALGGPGGAATAATAMRTAKAIPAVTRGTLSGVREELLKLKARRHMEANPGVAVEPIELDPVADAEPIPGELPSGRRPLTEAERQAKYGAPLPRPDLSARVSVKPEPGTPLSRLNPEQMANAQALAAEFGGDVSAPVEGATQYEAGARAKKVWNVADFLNEHKITPDLVELMDDGAWKKTIDALNADMLRDAAKNPNMRRPNRHAIPGEESKRQIMQELTDIQARQSGAEAEIEAAKARSRKKSKEKQ